MKGCNETMYKYLWMRSSWPVWAKLVTVLAIVAVTFIILMEIVYPAITPYGAASTTVSMTS